MKALQLDGSLVYILPVIKGLTSEAEKVREAFEECGPDAICVSISKEELAGLRSLTGEEEYEMNDIEWYYSQYLSRFGQVRIPPPCFLAAQQIGDENGVPVIPIDMNEELYSTTYCKCVSTLDLIRESFLVKRIGRMRFNLSSPEEFIKEWDARVNGFKGFRALQKEREEHMVRVLKGMAGKYGKILAVIEMERFDGIMDLLRESENYSDQVIHGEKKQ